MAFADSKGTRIYYDDKGKGEPVLLCLTGWCVHHTIFAPLAERFSAQHQVLVRFHFRDPPDYNEGDHPTWGGAKRRSAVDVLA
jgi:hypothetical protein